MRYSTFCLLIKENQVLLAMKKRGFGEGKWNGVGGKLEEGETIEQAAVRELEEEVGVMAKVRHLEKAGEVKFYFKDKPEWDQNMHIFLVKKWKGEPAESEEMRPKWFLHKDIPFGEMWQDDVHWLPKVLAKKRISGNFYFTSKGTVLDRFDIRVIRS